MGVILFEDEPEGLARESCIHSTSRPVARLEGLLVGAEIHVREGVLDAPFPEGCWPPGLGLPFVGETGGLLATPG